MLFVTCQKSRVEKVGIRRLGDASLARRGLPHSGCRAWCSLESLLVSRVLASGDGGFLVGL